MTDPLDRLAELMEKYDAATRAVARSTSDRHEHDDACSYKASTEREFCFALRNSAEALVAIARAAREVVARSGELDCYTPLAGAIDEMNDQLALLTPTQPEQK